MNLGLLSGCRDHLIDYAVAMERKFVPAIHHKLIAKGFELIAQGKIKRLMIFAPPRHGKSWMVSRFGPAWFLGRNPSLKIIAASHTHQLAKDYGGQVRNLIADPLHVSIFGPNSALTGDTAAKDFFRLVGGAEYYPVGVGGSPIGRGADIAIIDDPIKGRPEADSPTRREELLTWYRSKILSRLENDGAVILMHQRWHHDDLAGFLLRESSEEWTVINLPAIAEENDPLGRAVGDALWPEKFSKEYLRQLSVSIGPREWLSMYQQRPSISGGGEFKRGNIKLFSAADKPAQYWRGMNRIILVDAANSKKPNSDFTAMAVIGLGADKNYYLLDAVRERLSLTERADRLFKLHSKWQPRFVGYEQYGVMADIEHIESQMEVKNYRFAIARLGGKLKKEDRIRRMLPDLEMGKWWFPQTLYANQQTGGPVDIIGPLIEEEMLPFPVARHDDLLDAISRIYDMPREFPRAQSGIKPVSNQPSPW